MNAPHPYHSSSPARPPATGLLRRKRSTNACVSSSATASCPASPGRRCAQVRILAHAENASALAVVETRAGAKNGHPLGEAKNVAKNGRRTEAKNGHPLICLCPTPLPFLQLGCRPCCRCAHFMVVESLSKAIAVPPKGERGEERTSNCLPLSHAPAVSSVGTSSMLSLRAHFMVVESLSKAIAVPPRVEVDPGSCSPSQP